jgi:hypothetical protein
MTAFRDMTTTVQKAHTRHWGNMLPLDPEDHYLSMICNLSFNLTDTVLLIVV